MAAQKAADGESRRRRRIDIRPRGSNLVVKVAGKPLPGEDGPLQPTPGRAQPISDQEALGVMRRKARVLLATEAVGRDDPDKLHKLAAKGLPASREKLVPRALPEWNEYKEMLSCRVPARLRVLVEALAEVEGINVSVAIELALWKLVNSPPRDPQTVEDELAQMYAATVARDEFKRRLPPPR